MSFEQNYGIKDPEIEEPESFENILTNEKILEMQIENHIAEEENEIEDIKENYRRLTNEK